MSEKRNLCLLVWLACMITAEDPDSLALSPRRDDQVIVGKAALLCLVALAAAVTWSAFWMQFLNPVAAVGIGLFALLFMLFLDQFVGAAERMLHGFLKRPNWKRGRSSWFRLGGRLGISGVFCQMTATGAVILMFSHAIQGKQEQIRYLSNLTITQRYDAEEQKERDDHFGSLYSIIKDETEIIRATQPLLDNALKLQGAAANKLEASKTEAKREILGEPGYHRGAGPKYRAALVDEAAARADLARADFDRAIYEPRLEDAKRKLDKANVDLKAALSAIQPRIDQLEKERQNNLIPARNDPLLAYQALQAVYDDPSTGASARYFGWLVMSVLICIEISYIVVSTWFMPPMIYAVLLIGNTLDRAEEEALRLEQRREARLAARVPTALPTLKIANLDPVE